MLDYLSFAGLALMLGFKHSYDADHIIAVSTVLRKAQGIASAAWTSISWAAGHMLTATIVTVLLYAFRESFLSSTLPHFEKIVGVMLIALGLWSLRDAFSLHSHEHSHDKMQHYHPHTHPSPEKKSHFHKHMFGIGIIHGLASNDELLLLFTASLGVTTLGGILLGVGIFSIGVVLGMMLFSLLFSYPLLKSRSDAIYKTFSVIVGMASVLYGANIITGFL